MPSTFIDRFFGRAGFTTRTVRYDNTLRIPALVGAEVAGAKGDLDGWRAAYAACADADERHRAIWLIAEPNFPSALIKRWVERDRRDPVLQLVYAARMCSEGWEVRGAQRAEEVSAESFQVFHAHMEEALASWRFATEALPDHPTGWAGQMTAARVFSRPELIDGLYREGIERCGDTMVLHQGYLMALTPRWGGSAERMWAFARGTVRPKAQGSVTNALIAQAHFENMVEVSDIAAVTAPGVQAEIAAAARACWSPNFPGQSVGGLVAHNYFACALRVTNHADALMHFAHLDGRFQDDPWRYFRDRRIGDIKSGEREAMAAGLL